MIPPVSSSRESLRSRELCLACCMCCVCCACWASTAGWSLHTLASDGAGSGTFALTRGDGATLELFEDEGEAKDGQRQSVSETPNVVSHRGR